LRLLKDLGTFSLNLGPWDFFCGVSDFPGDFFERFWDQFFAKCKANG